MEPCLHRRPLALFAEREVWPLKYNEPTAFVHAVIIPRLMKGWLVPSTLTEARETLRIHSVFSVTQLIHGGGSLKYSVISTMVAK